MLYRTGILSLALVSIIGCTDYGDPVMPDCRLSSTFLDFGEVAPGDSVDRTLTVTNSGSVAIEGSMTISGAGVSIVSGGGSYILDRAQSLSVVVRFAPPDTGSYSGVVMTGGDCGDVPLSGEAVAPVAGAQCDVIPGGLDFGDVTVGSSTDLMFKITNSGPVDFSGTVTSPCADFTIVTGGGPYTLTPGDTLNVTVRFSPVAPGSSSCLIATGVNCSDLAVFGSGTTQNVSFSADIQAIFDTSCAKAGCHVQPTPRAGLDLRAGVSYANLVGVTSQNYAPAVRIVAGDPASSVLYGKVANTGQFGSRMPPTGAALTAQQIELIRVWILEGAVDN